MGAIFLKLLNMSITAGWLILAVLCVRLLFRKMPKWVNCLLWGVVAIRLMVPFSIESSLSLQPSAQPIQSSTMVSGEVLPYVPSVDSNLSIVENTVNPMLAETFAYSEEESVAPLQVVTEVAGIVWVVGMILLLVFALGSIIRLSLLVRESVLYRNNVFICDGVKSPFILGIIRPRIYLSSSLTEEEIEYIVAHERAHLKRKDHLWKPFGYLLLCIYWFNPLCWVAYMMLCKDIELACDEKVIRDMNFEDKKEYSRVLLACATQRRLVMACPLAFGEVGVKERVRTVLNYKKPAFWITLVAIVVCVVVAICFLTNPEREYQIRITIPAGSTEEIVYQEDFFYSDEEISPTGNKITLSLGEGVGDTEVVLKPIEVKEENAYEPTYITPGMPVKMDVEKGAWFQIGVNMQNPTEEDIDVYVSVQSVEVRIASVGEETDNTENLQESEQTQTDESELQNPEPDMNSEDVQRELERVVSSVGLENAYPWNNTVDFKSNADVLIKMASDETGRYEIYGIMSEKYGTYGLLLNDGIDGEQNWNYAYVPWIYSGAPSEQPTLELDGNGKYVFAYVYKYEDGVPHWKECILDCGYDTGHMELLSQEEVTGGSAVSEDYYEVATSLSADEVEAFALDIKEEILSGDWTTLSEKIAYPITIDGITLNGSSDFLELDINGNVNQEFVDGINAESCREMFCNYQGIMMGETGQIWFTSVEGGSGELKIIGINGMLDVAEVKPVPEEGTSISEGATMVDASKIARIVVVNGNTGDQIIVTGEEAYSEEYYFFNDLRKLYGQLDFSVQAVENERVGYQYSMVLYDAEGNKLQRVKPYKDGLTVDGAFYQYNGTGEGAKASLNLMEYMEYIFTPETTPFTEVAVNTLPNLTMTMEEYKSYEGELIISNQTGNDLKTWEWYDIQKWEDGAWHRLDQRTDGLWTDVLYQIPAGETTVFPTNWKTWYGDLPSGKYRIIKEIYQTTEDEIHTYYLAVEFEVN